MTGESRGIIEINFHISPYRLNLACMAPQLTSHSACLDIEYHNCSIDLQQTVNREIMSDAILKHTRPEARKSPLRLNFRVVACPDPKIQFQQDVDMSTR